MNRSNMDFEQLFGPRVEHDTPSDTCGTATPNTTAEKVSDALCQMLNEARLLLRNKLQGTTPYDLGLKYSAPVPGKKYIIIEKESGRAITHSDRGLRLSSPHKYTTAKKTWLLVETRNYFGFYNEVTDKFIGHEDNCDLCIAEGTHDFRAMFGLQHEENEWYRIMSPNDRETLFFVTAGLDGTSLVRREYGKTLFKFVEVESME
ncbi:hypothetical protein GGR57DRAFT_452973 [Xylariaceae sp. FL1272]|nr:hypothetical protein GGR57DRAFT_452973 [Xylariaceae sp. FL1272]